MRNDNRSLDPDQNLKNIQINKTNIATQIEPHKIVDNLNIHFYYIFGGTGIILLIIGIFFFYKYYNCKKSLDKIIYQYELVLDISISMEHSLPLFEELDYY